LAVNQLTWNLQVLGFESKVFFREECEFGSNGIGSNRDSGGGEFK